jgi:hypothetical protein
MTFSAPALKKAIKVAQDMGLAVSGYEIGPAGDIRVLTEAEAKNEADAALERWKKSRG